MGSRRKADDSARLLTVSRHALIGAATATPVPGSGTLAANDTVARCAEWLALDLEIDRLALRWAQLETQMARDHGWLALTPAERRALPEAAEMFAIEGRLEAQSRQRERMLKPLARLRAKTLHGVASQLVVAARLLRHEDNPAQPFVASALRELADMGCPGCGAAYAPPDVTQRR